jgi:hypothetical protein
MSVKFINALILSALAGFITTASSLDFKATCTIDRSKVRVNMPYKSITLKLKVGDAVNAEVFVDGSTVPSRIDGATKYLIFTTTGSSVDARVYGVSAQTQIGTFKKAALKDDKLWAWSHGYDDNVSYHKYGTEIFNKYGWAGTIFMIGSSIGADSANWICNAPDIRRLHKLGWAVGNHGYNHSTCDNCPPETLLSEIVRCQDRIRQVLASTDPGYKPCAFASPAFSHRYDSIVPAIRDNRPDIGVMWVEGQGPSPMRIDSGATEGPWRWVSLFDTNGTVGRTTNIYCYPTPCTISWGSGIDRFMDNVDSLVRFADSTHHYWFNTLEHGVDGLITDTIKSNDSNDVFGFVPWLYRTHGPGGNNTVWVAPSENIYSYIYTRTNSRLSATTIASTTPSATEYLMRSRVQARGPSIIKSIGLKNRLLQQAAVYDLRGQRILHDNGVGLGLFIVKRLAEMR